MSVTSLVVNALEAIFLPTADPRSWLHYVIFISFYTMFISCMRRLSQCRYIEDHAIVLHSAVAEIQKQARVAKCIV